MNDLHSYDTEILNTCPSIFALEENTKRDRKIKINMWFDRASKWINDLGIPSGLTALYFVEMSTFSGKIVSGGIWNFLCSEIEGKDQYFSWHDGEN